MRHVGTICIYPVVCSRASEVLLPRRTIGQKVEDRRWQGLGSGKPLKKKGIDRHVP